MKGTLESFGSWYGLLAAIGEGERPRGLDYTTIHDARDAANDVSLFRDAMGLSRYEHPIYVLTLDDDTEVSRETIL